MTCRSPSPTCRLANFQFAKSPYEDSQHLGWDGALVTTAEIRAVRTNPDWNLGGFPMLKSPPRETVTTRLIDTEAETPRQQEAPWPPPLTPHE